MGAGTVRKPIPHPLKQALEIPPSEHGKEKSDCAGQMQDQQPQLVSRPEQAAQKAPAHSGGPAQSGIPEGIVPGGESFDSAAGLISGVPEPAFQSARTSLPGAADPVEHPYAHRPAERQDSR